MEYKKSRWEYTERILLILTFLCTIIGTNYAIRTARKALEQASNELRPWVIIEQVYTVLRDERLESSFQVKNIGKTPAYVSFETKSYVNGKLINTEKPLHFKIRAIMPNQTMYPNGLTIKEEYKKILKKELVDKISQSIKVNYGTSKNTVGKYYVYQEVEFDQNAMPNRPMNIKQLGIWNLIDSDFQ